MVKHRHNKPRVVFYQRKPRPIGNYSLEFIFGDVRNRLRERIDATVAESKFESTGLFKRIFNCLQAVFIQGQVNHVTGDINYVGILLNKKKTIQTILDCVHLNSSTGLKYKILKLFWLSLPEKRSVFITAISESTKKEILRHHACDPAKIIVIPVAISPEFKYSKKEFNKANPRILQVGTAPNKNIPNLIEALREIPCTLNIVGKKNEAYESLLNKYNIPYIFEAGLSQDEIIRRYEMADIISLVSTYEGFGMPILEGQATGRAVITSNVFSMPEVAAEAAVIVNPDSVTEIKDGLKKIIENDVFRNDLIERGFANIRRFDADKIAGQYFDLYQKIVS